MPLFILGLIFVIGLFVYYLASTRSTENKKPPKPKKDEDIKQEENVIFLPNDIETAKKNHRKNK